MLGHQKIRGRCVCPQGCGMEPGYGQHWVLPAGLLCSHVGNGGWGKFSALNSQMAVKILGRKQALNCSLLEATGMLGSSSDTWGKSVRALVNLFFTAPCFLHHVLGLFVSKMWGFTYHTVLRGINLPDLAHGFTWITYLKALKIVVIKWYYSFSVLHHLAADLVVCLW